ncbi:unnamed protein product [Leptidea sinapis]|uniref:Uncharacterized protein n=1 Tax=Leptidea sinapis TaxID=189913 RepID=A0A5E4QS01_9NEOP|nr:unnamed protein product [Leptidea sinapis]
MNSQQRQQWIQSSLPWKNSLQGHKTSEGDNITVANDPEQLVSTNHTQPDNENRGKPIISDAIDRQQKQFHIRSTPGSTYRIENRSTSSRQVIKDVFIPVNNIEEEIIKFLKENTIADRSYTLHFHVCIQQYLTTETTYKGPYKIIHLHPNNIAEIIGSHPNSKSIRVHYKLLRGPHLVTGSSSQEPSCSTQEP